MKKKTLFNMNNIMKSMLLAVALLAMQMADAQSRNRLSVMVENAKLNTPFAPAHLFSITQDEQLAQFTKEGTALSLDHVALQELMQRKSNAITLTIPDASGKIYQLDVVKVEIASNDFTVGTKGTHPVENVNYQKGLYYRGIVKGDFNSIASVSLFNDEVMIMFANSLGNFVLGLVRNGSGKYALYNDKNVLSKPALECAIDYNLPNQPLINFNKNGGNTLSTVNCKVVHCYYQCDFAMYQAFSSNVTTTANYVTAAFNNEITLYANDGVTVEISQIYVWTSTDPEAGNSSTSGVNSIFISDVGSTFNGDMAQFLTTRGLGGGIAQGFSGLCNKSQAHSTCQVYTTYSAYPTYSWTVEVMTHEMGHLLGLRHTHACVWNGNNTAIDGCSGSTEGGCPLPGNPAGGGTIMSYCHLTSVGINFTLGFGPQPAAVLLSNVNNATCLTGSSAATPTGLNTAAITATTATLNWSASAGATQYTVQYKASASGTYITLGNFATTSVNLTGLNSNTSYDWQVNADCSPFSTAVTFTTTVLSGCGIPTGLTTTNISSTSAKLNWNAYSGATKYRIRYRVVGTTVWSSATMMAAYKTIFGLTPLTQYEWQVKALCSGTWTTLSSKKNFTTLSNGPPTGYCTSNGTDVSLEYINAVQVGTINNTSGSNGGYADFTAQSTTAILGSSVNVSISLIKSGSADVEYVAVFVDYNRDADFNDAGEMAYSANGAQATFTGAFTVPGTALTGQTRMRVSMQYGATPPTCGSYQYGEVEDYILNMTNGPARESAEMGIETERENIISIAPNPVSDKINISIDDENDSYVLQIFSVTGQLVKTAQLSGNSGTVDVSDLAKGVYQVGITGASQNRMNASFVKN